jgi:hypothetical protein
LKKTTTDMLAARMKAAHSATKRQPQRHVWTRAAIAKMTQADYKRNRTEILNQMRQGLIK